MAIIPVGNFPGATDKIIQELEKQQQKPEVKGPGKDFGSVISKASQPDPKAEIGKPEASQGVQKPQSSIETGFKGLITSWSKDNKAMDKLMSSALSGQKFNPGQMIMLQSTAFKYSFEMQSVSKLAETASSSIKTLFQTQV